MSDKTKTFSTRIKSKRDTSANWESANPVLLNGEKIIVDTSAGEVREKIGDGVKTYSQLPFTDEKIRGLITEKADEVELERLKYYGDKDIIPSPENYFTVNETGETITGLTATGKTQAELVIPYEINGVKITTLFSGSDSGLPVSILDGNSMITKVVIPKSVTTLGRGAFFSCAHLIDINIPDSVTSIGDNAFVYCSGLTSINLPNSVTSIGESAFLGCTNLKIYCEQGSYAETFAKGKNIPIVYTDIDPSKYLTKDNTTEFTPTGDYQPATKKYVDDSAATKVNKVKGKSLIDENVANNLSSDTTTVRIKRGTELKTNGSEINGVRIDDNSVTVEDVKNDMSDPYIGYKNVMDKDGLHIYGVDPGGNQDTNERVDITSSGVKYSGAQGNGRTLKLGFEGAGFPQLTMDGNPGESKSVKIDFDDVIVQNESTTHKLSEKVDKVEGKSLINSNVANAITYKDIIQPDSNNKNSFPEGVNCSDLTIGGTVGVDGSGVATEKYMIFEPATSVDPASIQFATINRNLANTSVHPTVTWSDVKFNSDGTLNLGVEGLLKMGDDLDIPRVTINATEGLVFDGSSSTTYSPGIKITSINGEIELTNESGTHKLSEKANASDISNKVSFGDNYNTSAAGASDIPITLHGITEGASTSNKPIGIKLNPGAGGGSTASITVGCDNSTDTATLSYDGLRINSTAQYSASNVSLSPLGLRMLNSSGSDMTQVKAGSVKCCTDGGNKWHELSEKAEAKTYTVSVPTTSWTEKTDTGNQKYYYKKITVSGMKASGQAMTDVVMSDSVATARQEMEAYQCVNRVITGNGYVELYCFEEVPTTAFTLRILVISNILS